MTDSQCLKITEKVSFNVASEASYIYILSGQKLIKNAKNGPFWRVFENLKLAVKQCYQTGKCQKRHFGWFSNTVTDSKRFQIWFFFHRVITISRTYNTKSKKFNLHFIWTGSEDPDVKDWNEEGIHNPRTLSLIWEIGQVIISLMSGLAAFLCNR